MGLFSGLFGKKKKASDPAGDALRAEEARVAQEERDRADALKRKQEEERLALKTRGATMQGGGRAGLMFGANRQGV